MRAQCPFFLIYIFLTFPSCQKYHPVDLAPYGIPADIQCESPCKIYELDWVVIKELNIGQGLNTLQLLYRDIDLDAEFEEDLYFDAVFSEIGFDKILSRTEDCIFYTQKFDQEVFYKFRCLYFNGHLLVLISTPSEHRLSLERAKDLMQKASTFRWKEANIEPYSGEAHGNQPGS